MSAAVASTDPLDMHLRILGAVFASALALVGSARAGGGSYVFAGGSAGERAQVVQALEASSFPWGVVPQTITIHIARGILTSNALPGQIWLDADLLDTGRFSWGTVQMEYAHQVHFLMLDDAERAGLTTALGAQAWCWEKPGVAHGDNGCERFSATLAWAYWQSDQNALRPEHPGDEAGAMPPAQFRAMLAALLGNADLAQAQQPATPRALAVVAGSRRPAASRLR
jgi:hypothetical protein